MDGFRKFRSVFAGDVGLNERSSSKRWYKHKLGRYIVELLMQRDFTQFLFMIALEHDQMRYFANLF